jgi:hypothetical protein
VCNRMLKSLMLWSVVKFNVRGVCMLMPVLIYAIHVTSCLNAVLILYRVNVIY